MDENLSSASENDRAFELIGKCDDFAKEHISTLCLFRSQCVRTPANRRTNADKVIDMIEREMCSSNVTERDGSRHGGCIFVLDIDSESLETGVVVVPVDPSSIQKYIEDIRAMFNLFKKIPSLKYVYGEIYDSLLGFLWHAQRKIKATVPFFGRFDAQTTIDMLKSLEVKPSRELRERCCKVMLENPKVQRVVNSLKIKNSGEPVSPVEFLDWIESDGAEEDHPLIPGNYRRVLNDLAQRLANSYKYDFITMLRRRIDHLKHPPTLKKPDEPITDRQKDTKESTVVVLAKIDLRQKSRKKIPVRIPAPVRVESESVIMSPIISIGDKKK